MDMTGEYRIPAPRARVWEALNDPETLRACIAGCEEVVKVSDTEFTARVVAKVGPVKAKFSGKVTLSDIDPPAGYVITGEGSGGVAGFGKGGATVRLAEDGPDATVLTYEAHASVGGKLAQIGSRLVDSAARKMADDFFSCFAERLSGPAPVLAGEPVPATPIAPAAVASSAAPAQVPPEPAAARESFGSTPHRTEESVGEMGEASALAAVAAPTVVGGMEPPGRLAEPAPGLSPKIWVPALIVLVAILLIAFL
ncbi:SRPBCC family protein [Arenibaculum pallidiluteum]|uniref:SRPBCC family protein n=1 Tax=Arenibaculum pallidiluteum TaxID=2812559 RepID=UPI001A97A77F|nr:carbon monoxide dehydrogenase subunit G [Arenibaculum pallidiluteum]